MPNDAPCDCGCPNTFSSKSADDDLARYLKDGPDGTTSALIDAIAAEGIEGATLLDIGGGIGAIQLELLAKGLDSAQAIDATEAYVAVARSEARRRGYGERISSRFGDFAELATEIDPADIVTLDRVVCCDPDLETLLGRAADHARRIVGLVYPRDAWWNRVAARAIAVFGWITRDSTRWYLHRPGRVDEILRGCRIPATRRRSELDLAGRAVRPRARLGGASRRPGLRSRPSRQLGSENQNVVVPASELAPTRPPASSTRRLTIASPIPAPPDARSRDRSTRKNRSQTRGRSSAGISLPLFETRTIAPPAPRETSTRTSPPAGVYRIAFCSRFETTCASSSERAWTETPGAIVELDAD